MRYQLAIFDMDGTLTEELIDFAAIRRDLGTPGERGILEHLAGLTGEERRVAEEILHRHESAAAHRCQIHEGAAELLQSLRGLGVKMALLTRNSSYCANTILGRHGLELDYIATRGDAPHKPHPDSILNITRRFRMDPGQTLMIGDYLYDLQAAHAAGVDSALVLHKPGEMPAFASMATYCVRGLRELTRIIERGEQDGR
jgi:HAD superfamily hydrolase (TIGR01549 family)